ncbi:MAG: FmdB family zinc ribbon protein [Candidatus Velthaea sp.]
MPLYDYRCQQCDAVTEVRHGFKETHSAPCAACGGTLRRVFNAAGIVFKGAGFYINDSRKASAPKDDAPSPAADKAPPAKPAATEATKSEPAA